MSDKRKALNAERREVLQRLLAERGEGCEMRCSPHCRGVAECGHELLKRSAGGSIVDPSNILLCCIPCNEWVEDNPKEARERGFSRSRYE